MQTSMQLLNESAESLRGKFIGQNQYGNAHFDAMQNPRPGFERAIVYMLKGWAEYADAHAKRYDSAIGDDGVLGDPWETIGQSIIDLLNGETGRLDCGTLDGVIRRIAREQNATEVIEQ